LNFSVNAFRLEEEYAIIKFSMTSSAYQVTIVQRGVTPIQSHQAAEKMDFWRIRISKKNI